MGGVSFNLAGKLGLTNIRFLEPVKSKRFKLVTFVPAEVTDKVSDAVFHAGGGVIGAYSKCSFSSNGKGTFYGDESSNPAVGVKGRIETVDEVRLEIIFNEWERVAVLKAITSSHPYEQPALDIYKLDNDHESFGSGAVGELSKEISETEFLKLVSQSLKIPSVRHSVLLSKKIKRVALCGGAGEEYYKAAISAGADAFVTADIR